jgi:predicted enzyme related to lactoylglutathione lyase
MRLLIALCVLSIPFATIGQQASRAAPPLVFFDIVGPDGPVLQAFYEDVFGFTIGADGGTMTTATPAMRGLIGQDAAARTMLYFGVDDVSAALRAVEANGGSIDAPRFEVPGVVVLGLFRDPAGNRVGLVEMLDGRPKVP